MPELDTAWLVARPPAAIDARGVTLRAVSMADAEALAEAAQASAVELRPWMPWAEEPITVEGMREFTVAAARDWEAGTAFQYVIRSSGVVVGCCGLHNRVGPGALEIGYWVRTDHTGRGIATAAARALTEVAFALGGVEQATIRCDVANGASAAIARKAGYRLDRVEDRPVAAVGETGRHMIWVQDRA